MGQIKQLPTKEIVNLAKRVLLADRNDPNYRFSMTGAPGTGVSYEAMHETLKLQFKLLCGEDMYDFKTNHITIFKILTEVIDEVLPKKVMQTIGRFAEVKIVKQGDKPEFKRSLGKSRAKGFISKAGLAGTYDVFRLDSEYIEVATTAHGGACIISIEEFLDGRVDFNELMQIVLTELENSIYKETRYAMEALAATMPVNTYNKAIVAGFNREAMSQLLTGAKSYSGANGAQILATETFAAKMRNDIQYLASEADKMDLREQGYIGKISGADVILLPNAFEDDTNRRMVFQDRYAYIIPTSMVNNATEKIIKVAIEGKTLLEMYDNKDRSKEIQVYKKLGVAIVTSNPHIAVYEDTEIPFIRRNRRG